MNWKRSRLAAAAIALAAALPGLAVAAAPAAHAAGVAYDTTGPSSAGAKCATCTSLSWSHTVAGNALLAGVAVGKNGDSGLTATATYNGVAMTLLKTVHDDSQPDGFLDVFGLLNPASGTHSVVATVAGGTASEITGGSESFSGAGSFGTAVSAYGSSTHPSVTTAGSTTGSLIAGFAANGSSFTSATSPSTSRYLVNQDGGTGAGNSAGATSPATGSNVTMAWTVANDWWSAAAVEVKASTGVQQAPTVATQAATGITSSSATLNGTVNPNGAASTYHFEYGTTTSYGTLAPVPDGSAGSGTSAVAESAGLTGLSASTTYHYRLDATNSAGTTSGADQQFTTSATGTITNLPGQPAITDYQAPSGNGSNAIPYEHQGALIVAAQNQLSSQPMKDASAAGATVLAYLDPMVLQPGNGTYADLLWNASSCGPAVPQWGSYNSGSYPLADFRTTADGGGGTEQAKLQCVLEQIVTDNPQIGGFFADDLGSMSWYPGIPWSSFGSANQQAWRDGAIALAQTFHTVAVEHHLMLMVNGTWGAGTLAANGGGYPAMTTPGLSLADGGYIEHHATSELSYWTAYAQGQWATASGDAAAGKPVMYVQAADQATMNAYNNAGVFSFLSYQTDYSQPAPVWGSFHATGLPSHTS